ncbi:MAG: phasin family protein, partial [Candidatus Marinimicrobia bacterium]|nr:phasin family protein [Candidatus Neomarinimicrobiota bacterium]
DELIKKGEMAKDERSKAIRELLKKAEEQEKLLSGKVNAEIRKTMEKLGIPTRKDIERLEKKIDRLQKQ